jgi:hypothetical protein
MQTPLRFRTDPAHTTSQFELSLQNQYSQPAGAEGLGADAGCGTPVRVAVVYILSQWYGVKQVSNQ